MKVTIGHIKFQTLSIPGRTLGITIGGIAELFQIPSAKAKRYAKIVLTTYEEVEVVPLDTLYEVARLVSKYDKGYPRDVAEALLRSVFSIGINTIVKNHDAI